CTLLLPLAVTIFGFSNSSAESEGLSGDAGAGACCSFFGFAGFLAPKAFGGASAFGAGAFSLSLVSAGTGADFGSSAFGSSGLALVGLSGSAIILISLKLCRLSPLDCALRQPFCVVLCLSGHLSKCAGRARAGLSGDGCRDKN